MESVTHHTVSSAQQTPKGRCRRDFVNGAWAMTPMLVGYVSFGLVVGAALSRSQEPWAAWAGTDLIYGGSAHLTLIELLRTGSGLWAAAGAALLINARLLVSKNEVKK